jgi:hypothetical protein
LPEFRIAEDRSGAMTVSAVGSRSRPALSVVMPSFNQAAFIGEAIESIDLANHPDVELVVADGGSHDGTLDRLADFGSRYPGQVRWTSAPDGGPAAAVNAAVAASRAPLIGWLNADDLYAEAALDRVQDRFRQRPDMVMVYGHGEHADAFGRTIQRYPTKPPPTTLDDFLTGCFVCQPTAFFRRDAFVALGGLDTTLKTAFDFDFWIRLHQRQAHRVGFIDAVLARSRLHPGTITSRERRTVAMEALQILHRHLGTPWPEAMRICGLPCKTPSGKRRLGSARERLGSLPGGWTTMPRLRLRRHISVWTSHRMAGQRPI